MDGAAGSCHETVIGMGRALDIFEGDQIDAEAFMALIREAVALNKAKVPK